jgi:hypothetical protein
MEAVFETPLFESSLVCSLIPGGIKKIKMNPKIKNVLRLFGIIFLLPLIIPLFLIIYLGDDYEERK